MAHSYVQYTGNGVTTDYTITFPYIEQTNVEVRVNDVLKTVTTDYTFSSSTTIHFLSAPANGVIIDIRRKTEEDSRLVNFTDGSNLIEADLDASADQLFYLQQELLDALDDTLTLASDTKWDAENHIIKNLTDGVTGTDAATVGHVHADTGDVRDLFDWCWSHS